VGGIVLASEYSDGAQTIIKILATTKITKCAKRHISGPRPNFDCRQNKGSQREFKCQTHYCSSV